MHADLLHVVTAISNPIRWESRIRLYRQFRDHMVASGVNLTVVELAYGDRPFELEDHHPKVQHVGVRANTMLWSKENLLNIGISRLPPDWKYVAWVDADTRFRRGDWAAETVHELQHYAIIQPWSDCYDLGPGESHLGLWKSFCCKFWQREQQGIGKTYSHGHTGYAWAARRDTINHLGGLIETAALGAGDHHMAWALVGKAGGLIHRGATAGYAAPIRQWEALALKHVDLNIGFLHGTTIEHFWHGRKHDRSYQDRWQIILRHGFDPLTDLKRNSFGVYELAGNKPELRHDIDAYFRSRNEDLNG